MVLSQIQFNMFKLMGTSSDWSHFVIFVCALKVREEAERTHIIIMGKT